MEKNKFEVEGKVEKVLISKGKPNQAGEVKEYVTLVLFVDGKYPEHIPVEMYGRNADEARTVPVGSLVQVAGSLGGREWNGKVYPKNLCWNIKVIQAALPETAQEAPKPESTDDVPF